MEDAPLASILRLGLANHGTTEQGAEAKLWHNPDRALVSRDHDRTALDQAS